ncbi:MAG TPA: hypothetical protein VFE33_32255 [Thermoanaerobaculia bacterium]|nr:hypothetical protein [Thermoanaerobaculia bacterium]
MLKNPRHARTLLFLLPAALLANGCMHRTSKPKQLIPAGEEVRIEGTLTQAEFGCLGVRTADGRRFSILRDIEGSRPGQHVWIQGYVVKTKGCMPGLTLMPRQAGLLPETPAAQPAVATTR